MGWGGGVVAHEILVSAQSPLVLGFWVLGLRVWGQGLTKIVESGACVYGNHNILVLLEHGGLPHFIPLSVHLIFLGGQVEGTTLRNFYL